MYCEGGSRRCVDRMGLQWKFSRWLIEWVQSVCEVCYMIHMTVGNHLPGVSTNR